MSLSPLVLAEVPAVSLAFQSRLTSLPRFTVHPVRVISNKGNIKNVSGGI